MSHTVNIEGAAIRYACAAQESVLEGMHRLGVRGIPCGCRSGGCGVCKVEILEGEYRSRVMSREHVSEDDLANRRVLACRVYPESDLSLRVIGKLRKCVLDAAADGQRSI